ncbi:MAG: tetratricopeptide repeat protein, partial [Microcystaceae cyanobacterium]
MKRSLILAVLLFFLSMGLPPVFAQISVSSPIAQERQPADKLVQQGQKLYEAGQFEEAIAIWQQAAAAFVAQGDKLNQAMALSNLALTFEQRGQWNQANQRLADSLKILKALESTPERARIFAQTL